MFSVKYEISILYLHSQIAFITPDYNTLIFLQHLIGKNIGLQYSHFKFERKSHHENVVNYETFGVTYSKISRFQDFKISKLFI